MLKAQLWGRSPGGNTFGSPGCQVEVLLPALVLGPGLTELVSEPLQVKSWVRADR